MSEIVRRPSLEEIFGTDPEAEDGGVLHETGAYTPDGRKTGFWISHIHRHNSRWMEAQQRHSAPFRHMGRPLQMNEALLIDQNSLFDAGFPKPWENLWIGWQIQLDPDLPALLERLYGITGDPTSLSGEAAYTRKNWLWFANDRRVGRKVYGRILTLAQDYRCFRGARPPAALEGDAGNS